MSSLNKNYPSINYLVRQIRKNPTKKDVYLKLVVLVSRIKFDISEDELTQLKELDNFAPNDELNWLINYAIYNVETRINNYLDLSIYNYKIVSLGCNCMSRTIPTRWGLKLPKIMGELSHPFDLSVHPYRAVCQVIKNDFKDYLNPLFLKQNQDGIPKNQKYRIVFNHEKDSCFTENNFTPLIKTYEARIKNFYHDTNKYPILFLHFSHPQQNIFPIELAQIIHEKFKNIYHKFLYVNTAELNFDLNNAQLAENMIAKYIPFPSKEYIWHQSNYYATKSGKNFELNIMKAVKQVIMNYFPKI